MMRSWEVFKMNVTCIKTTETWRNADWYFYCTPQKGDVSFEFDDDSPPTSKIDSTNPWLFISFPLLDPSCACHGLRRLPKFVGQRSHWCRNARTTSAKIFKFVLNTQLYELNTLIDPHSVRIRIVVVSLANWSEPPFVGWTRVCLDDMSADQIISRAPTNTTCCPGGVSMRTPHLKNH